MTGPKIALAGSYRAAPEGATDLGDVDPQERITIVVHVKRRTPDQYQPGSAGDLARLSRPMTWETLAGERRRTHTRAVKRDRKSTRLNSSHGYISYAVFCLKKK